eukprot:3882051-Karenia_brevis.AAC.1
MHVLATEAGSEDIFFNLDVSCGLPCTGRAAHSFVMPLKVTRPLLSVAQLHEQAAEHNKATLSSIKSSGDHELDIASKEKTQAEIDS